MTAVAAVKRQHHGLTLAVLAVAGMSFALLQTMVAPALPAIQHELRRDDRPRSPGSSPSTCSPPRSATPILGRIGDMFGKERLLVIVLLVLRRRAR